MSGLSGRRVVCLSSIPWHAPIVTSRQHLARILARDNDVLFVDPPTNLLRGQRPAPGLHEEADGLRRLVPPSHAPYGTPRRMAMTGPVNEARYARAVLAGLRELGWRDALLWTSCPVAFAGRLAEDGPWSGHLFHMTDAYWHYPWFHAGYERRLHRLLICAQRAAGTTPAITERLAGYGVPSEHLAHGIDADHFGPAARAELTSPARLRDRARPRIGFVGNLESRLDVDALLALARGPGSLTLLGPDSLPPAVSSALRDAGAWLEGPVPYAGLPAWLAGMDVAVLPYRRSELVLQSRPLKLLEYLAAGLPVVAADIPAARELGVELAREPADYTAAVERLWSVRDRAIEDPDVRASRLAQAAEHSWDEVAQRLGRMLGQAESDKRAAA